VEELAEVLAIDFNVTGGIPKLNEGFRWADQEEAVLSACSSLVVIVKDWNWSPRRVQFSHFSVKEFLTSDRLATSTVDVLRDHHIRLEPAHTIMAQACLGVLLRLNDHMDKEAIEGYPLAKYAGQCFVEHAKFGDVLSYIDDGLDYLLDPDNPHFNTWLWLQVGDWDRNYLDLNPDSSPDLGESLSDQSNSEHPVPVPKYPPRVSPLFYTLALGHLCLTQRLILKRPHDLDASDIYGKTALHLAMLWPDGKVAQMLIECTIAINGRDKDGWTPLHYAMYDGDHKSREFLHCVRLLLDRGADVEAQNNHGSTPLHLAASRMSQETVQLLIEFSANINLRNNKGQTALHNALQRGHLGIMQLILNHGADVDALDNDGSTLLHLAISEASMEAVQLLLEHGANIKLQNDMGQTLLHQVLESGFPFWAQYLETTRLLLINGSDVDAQDHGLSAPLHIASCRGLTEAAELLLKYGSNVHMHNSDGCTPLHCATRYKHLDTMRLLLERDADVDASDHTQSTPLHLASCEGSLGAVQLLLEHRADVHVRDQKGGTPLHDASWGGYIEVLELLLEQGADVDAQSKRGLSALHLASYKGDLEIVQLLLKHGANIHLQDDRGRTPFKVAEGIGAWEIMPLLTKHGQTDQTA
jgi:ankyrin repeat protein